MAHPFCLIASMGLQRQTLLAVIDFIVKVAEWGSARSFTGALPCPEEHTLGAGIHIYIAKEFISNYKLIN